MANHVSQGKLETVQNQQSTVSPCPFQHQQKSTFSPEQDLSIVEALVLWRALVCRRAAAAEHRGGGTAHPPEKGLTDPNSVTRSQEVPFWAAAL